jgi:hypothetical protein
MHWHEWLEKRQVSRSPVVGELLQPLEYETNTMVGRVEVRKMCVQVNFLGEAEGGEARVNMEEHSVAVWVDETDVEGLEILSRFLRFE